MDSPDGSSSILPINTAAGPAKGGQVGSGTTAERREDAYAGSECNDKGGGTSASLRFLVVLAGRRNLAHWGFRMERQKSGARQL